MAPLTLKEAVEGLNAFDEFALYHILLSLECRGRIGSGTECPIARYLKKATGLSSLIVTAYGYTFIPPKSEYANYTPLLPSDDRFQLADAVRRFIEKFDRGNYPDLIERSDVPLTLPENP